MVPVTNFVVIFMVTLANGYTWKTEKQNARCSHNCTNSHTQGRDTEQFYKRQIIRSNKTTKFNNTLPTKDSLYIQRLPQIESKKKKKWESVVLKKARAFIASKTDFYQ